MPALTRRRSDNPHREIWHVNFDGRVGTIGTVAGVPIHADLWAWSIGFASAREPCRERLPSFRQQDPPSGMTDYVSLSASQSAHGQA